MVECTDRSKSILSLTALLGLCLTLALLLGLPRMSRVVAGQSGETSATAEERLAAAGLVTATSSYTYYFPAVFHDYVAPVWTLLGPTGANVRDLVVDPQTPNRLYIGTTEYGIYRSVDEVGTWERVNEGLPSGPTANILAMDPLTPTNLYAGVVGYPNFYRSVNGGNNWQAGGALWYLVASIAVAPVSPNVLYVGTWPFESGGGQVLRSDNAGVDWVEVLPSMTHAAVIVVDPVTPTIVYAETGSLGLIKSMDGGGHWAPVQDGTGHELGHVRNIAIDPGDHDVLYTATADKVLKSSDGGNNWVEIGNGLPGGLIHDLVSAPTVPGIICVRMQECTAPECDDAIYKSTDAGESWSLLSGLLSNETIRVMAVDPFNPEVLYVGTDGYGVLRYGQPLR